MTNGLVIDNSSGKIYDGDGSLDVNNNQIKNFRAENIATPVAGNAGRLILDGTSLKFDTGAVFNTIATMEALSLNGSDAIMVDGGRTDTYTADGSAAKPYKTITAALAVATANAAIRIAPGVYSENIIMPDISGISIIGSGTQNTVIVNASGSHTISWVPTTSGIASFFMSNLSVVNTATGSDGIHFDATAVADFAYDTSLSGFIFSHVNVLKSGTGNAVKLTRLNFVFVDYCNWRGGPTVTQEPSVFSASNTSFDDFDTRYDDAMPTPNPGITGRQIVQLINGCSIGSASALKTLYLKKTPLFLLGPDSVVFGSVDATGLSFNASSPVHGPITIISGVIGTPFVPGSGAMTFSFPSVTLLAFAPFMVTDFSRGTFFGPITMTIAGTFRHTVNARQSQFRTSTVGAISVGDLIDFDIRGSHEQTQTAIVTVSSGTVDRKFWDGDFKNTNQGYLSNSTASTPVSVRDNDGLSVQAADAFEGVRFRTLHVNTTNSATPTELTFDGAAASGSNTLTLANGTTHGYVIWVTARCTAGTNVDKSAMYRIELAGTATGGSASLVGIATPTIIAEEIAAWDATISFTSNRLQIFGTGDAGSTLHWTAVVQETTVS